MTREEQALLKELLTKHKLPEELIISLRKESKSNMYEQRTEAKKLHELESLIAVQISDDREKLK